MAKQTSHNDTALITLLRENPEKGCAELLRQYTPLVLGIARRRLQGCCSAEDIEELTADILFKCWQQREKLDTAQGSIHAYIATLAARRCIDYYRAHSRKPAQQPIEALADTLPDSSPDPEAQAISNERRKALLDAVKALGEPDTEIILRKYYQNQTAAEIARSLSMQTGAVEMRLSRARKKLREMLGGADV